MPRWIKVNQARGQLVLFEQRLDEIIPPDHSVRVLDEILTQLDWSQWEAEYVSTDVGQPAFHPRVLTGVILYGLMAKVRASRALENALIDRMDFRWLAGGFTIDHTTLCTFRRRHPEQLKDLFVQVVLVARELGVASLSELAFDGTRVRANNHRQRTRTPAQLRKLQKELSERFDALAAEADALDLCDQGVFGNYSGRELSEELADLNRRALQIEKALAELQRIDLAGEAEPKRIPLTDPESRLIPNKEGGFAANYTPFAGVDVGSGLIVTQDVLAQTTEEHHLMAAITDVQEQFDTTPESVLADQLFATAANLEDLEQAGVTLYSPPGTPTAEKNPAVRDDLTQPVSESQYEELSYKNVKGGGKQLDKSAFIYDAENDVYRCPQGNEMSRGKTTTDHRKDGTIIKRTRYSANAIDCAECPLKPLCVTGKKTDHREISRDQFEEYRERLGQRMATEEGQEMYAKRCSVGERPFAVIKQQFGARQFLLRGLAKVKIEWNWLTIAFNLTRLQGLLSARAGPADPT